MKRNAIVLDFDHTLFHTTAYVSALKKALQACGVMPELFDEKRQYLKDCCRLVDIDTFVTHLAGNKAEVLHGAVHALIKERAHDFIFSDVQAFLTAHHDAFYVVILTQGDQELQHEKITHSGITGIDEIIITGTSKDQAIASIVERYGAVHYIEDKAKHIDEVKRAFPDVITYFLRRPEDQPYGDIPSTCNCTDHTITDLKFTIEDEQ